MFTWSEYIPDEIISCFEEVYGITVNHDTFASQGELLAKLERGASGYDVVQPSDDMVQLMVEKDLFAELDKSQLPVMSNFNPAFLNPAFDPDNKYSLPYQGGSTGIVYNSETIKTPPTSYADLWNAEYAGHIIAVDDSRTMITLTLLELGYDANSTDPAQLKKPKRNSRNSSPTSASSTVTARKPLSSGAKQTSASSGAPKRSPLSLRNHPSSMFIPAKASSFGRIISP